ncbi:hypothetical protein PENANT_c012G00536 [Penicillium antarcticum]|uniref:PCI domain-containing protein n=1 Tax=Penicillium antarcticum TaxID=416450 RepID=A0A1V6Q5S4_9EURO|nr:uncharacterized protein N7508_007969 [Penicillium antarcticum]KAJ5297720.1 hypothetical protein N7508_007969 [Penicillium antarcticum]OQD84591.1 hypothetical protein PENANT_c012G00536 [Penicillium antarcticum]
MDQVHARALEALQPFVLLAKSTSASSPRFIANIITNATSSPQTYVFAELLELPAVQALRSPDTPADFQGHLKLLEIFAWGTLQDYQATPNLPQLNPEQTTKLRLLSLLSLSTTIKPLTYTSLKTALSSPTTTDLESLITTAIYASLITARLSPASKPPLVNITAVSPLRDVQPTSLPRMISTLTEWESRCGDTVTDLEAEIARIKSDAAKRAQQKYTYGQRLDKSLERRQNGASGEGGAGGSGRRGNRARFGAGLGGSKRDADDIDQDDGFFETGDGEGSRMEIDEGAGAGGRAGNSRSKRVLGRKS